MKLSRVLGMLAVSFLLSSSLLAVPSYGANSFAVSDATLTHGLGVWGLYDGDPSTLVRLSFESGSQLVVNADGTASLNGFVEVVDLDGGPGAIGELWDITVELVYRGTGPEGEGSGGPRHLFEPTFTDNWEYYDVLGAVMIRADNSSDVVVLTQFPPGSVFPFQLGFGASGKNLDFGASVDFSYERAVGGAIVTEGNAALFVDANLIGEVDLSVTIQDTPDPVRLSDLVTYSITISNAGPQLAVPVTLDFLTDFPNSAFVSAQTNSTGGSCNTIPNVNLHVECSLPVVDPGETVDSTIVAVASTEGELTVVAQVASAQADFNEANNQVTENTTVVASTGADLSTEISDFPDPVLADGPLRYTVSWANHGPATASQATAALALDPRATFLSFTLTGTTDACEYLPPTRQIECTFFNIGVNQILQLTVDVQLQPDPNAVPGGADVTYSLLAAASIQSDIEPDSQEENNVDDESTTVFTCISDVPCLRGILEQSDSGGTHGCAFVPNDNATCSAPCFGDGICIAGACELGPPLVCEDNPDECSDNECNPATGACESVDAPDDTLCSPSVSCRIGAMCMGGQCIDGPEVVCEDGNICTDDFCDPNTGECTFALNSDPCNDGNVCNDTCDYRDPNCNPGSYDQCVGGECVGSLENNSICDDGNVCTTDSCDPVTGCESLPVGGSCNDDNACTALDQCIDGVCVGTESVVCEDSACATFACDPDSNEANCAIATYTPGVVCRTGSGDTCDPDEVCAGQNADCPADFLADSSTVCNAGSGDVCDPDELCTGLAGEACPADEFEPATTVCRDSTTGDNTCDPLETCTGVADDTCPDNTFADAGTLCGNSAMSACTEPDSCDGAGTCEFNNTECGFVTDSGLCEFDVEPTKGDCSTDGSACVFDMSCADTGGVTCTAGGVCLDASGANIGACVPDGICGDNCDQSDQFRLVFTPDVKNWPAHKLSASNPGQTFYNVMYDGSQELLDGDDVNLAVTVPYPYVTVGGMPLHVYAGDTVPSNDLGCLAPEEPLFSEPLAITIDDWINGTTAGSYGLSCDAVSGPSGAGSCTFEVTVPNGEIPAGGLLYVNLHLDYGLKGKFVDANPVGPYPLDAEMLEDRYDRRANVSVWGSSDALVNTATDDGPIALEDCRSYWFEHTDGAAVPLFQDQVQNLNIFKQIAGAFGRTWCADSGDGFDYYVQLVSPSGNWIKRTQADEDGYYALNHKHKGKPAFYTVEAYTDAGYSNFVHSTTVELQGNGWAEVNLWNSCATTSAWDSSVTYGSGRNKKMK